jgi:hypothetical protein
MKNKLSTQEIRINTAARPAYVVLCSSVGNPDFRQDPELPISPPEQYVCHTIKQCSEACRNYITTHNLGGGNWTGGQILHPDKGQIAIVSYNGRVWKENGQKKKVLFPDGKIQYMDAVDYREELTEGLNEELK